MFKKYSYNTLATPAALAAANMIVVRKEMAAKTETELYVIVADL